MKAVSCLIGLCLLAVAANADFAWQKGQQYKYQVRGRAMAGISGLPNQYAGIQLEYYQIVTVKSDGVLNVKTEDLKIVDTNEELFNGAWRDGQIRKGEEPSVPQELKHFLTSPMDLIVKQGVVEAIKVQSDLPTWAVNIKRAMASEFTMDTIGQHQYIQGNLNRHLEGQTPEEQNQESGFFYKVEEETVHGVCPTYYTVSQNGPFDAPFQFQAQRQAGANTGRSAGSSESQETLEGKRQYGNRAYKAYKNAKKSGSSRSVENSQEQESSKEQVWPRAFNQLCEQDDQVYEILKVTNFTACAVKPVLGYNAPAGQHAHAGDNAAGSLAAHALVTRVLACGKSRKNFTLLQINQQEQFLTGLRNIEKVEGGAQKNITLISIRQGQATPIQNPKTINSLVYQYDPKEQQQVMKGKLQYAKAPGASASEESSESAESMAQYSAECQGQNQRQCRRERRQQLKQQQQRQYGQQQESSQEWQGQQQKLAKPELDQAPLASMAISPLKLDGLKTRVISLMQEIAQGLVKSTEKDSIAQREILSKISTVVKALRRFNRPAIDELAQKLTQSGNEQQEVTRSIFLDALAISGTNPAIVYLLEQVEAGSLNGEEAAQTLATLPMYIRTPTQKLIARYFAIIENESVKRQIQVRTTAMLSFTTLLYNACVNKQTKNTRYPVALYGEFCDASVAQKYVPFFIEKLEKRLEQQQQEQGQNKHWIVTLLASLGNIGHPDVIEVVQKIMDEETDSFIKTKAIFALKHLIVSRSTLNQQQQYSASRVQQGSQRLPIPVDRQSRDILTNEVVEKQVLPVLMSVAFDKGEHPQVRNAAFSLLFHCTYADVTIWQQIALATWFEPSRDVRSFILSSLKSLAEVSTPIQGHDWTMKRKAASVLPLAKPIDASVLRSHNLFTAQFIQELNSGFAQQLVWFQGEDSILPNNLYYRNFFQFGNGAAAVHPVEFSITGNTIQKLANAFVRAVYENQQEQQQQKEGHKDLSEIKNLLNIEPRKQGEPVQGSIHLKLREEIERMWTFDEETLINLAQQIREQANKQGEINVNYQKVVHMAESLSSMPTIFGFPLVFSMRMPALISVRGTLKLENPQGKEVTLQADLAPVYAWKIHTQVAFKVPFTGKKYQAGVQRHFVVEAPFSAVARRSPQGELQLALTPAHLSSGAPSGTINLITYHQLPYTAIITDEFYPTNHQQGGKMQIIHANKDQKDNYQNKRHYGQSALGFSFEIEEQSEFPEQVENMSGWTKFVRRFHSAGCAFNAAWLGSSHLRYAKREIVLDIDKSETKTIVLLLAARVQRESVARQLQSSEEGQSKESQSNSQSNSQSESGSKSGSSSSSSSESEEGKRWFNIVRSPAARRQQQQLRQQQQQKKEQKAGFRASQSSSSSSSSSEESESSSESNSKSSSSSSESSESQSQSQESGRKHRKSSVLVLALLGKKAPLISIDELKGQSGKQRVLQSQSDNTVQYLAQLNLRHGQVFVRLAAGSAANQAAENLPESSKAFRAIREQVKQGANSKSQPEACIEFEGTMDTPKKASRHIVAIRRHTLLAQDLSVKVQGKLTAGQNCRVMPLFVKIQGKLRRDQEMTEWARSKSPEAQKCKKDEKKGFTISQICMDVAEQQAAALNEYKFTIEHSAMPKLVQNMTVYHVQNLLKAALYPYMSENQFPKQSTLKANTFQIIARMTPNKEFLSMEIRKPESVLTFSNVKTGRFIKAVLPLTASQTLYSNIKDRLLRSQSDSMCALEKNYVNTFDNVTYSFNQQAAKGCEHVLAKDCSGRYPMAVLVKDLQQVKGRTVTVILGQHKIKLIPQGGESRTSPKISTTKSLRSQEQSFESQEQGQRGSSRMTVLVDGQRKEQLPITIRYGNKKHFVAEVMEMPNGGVQVIGRRIQVATDGARVIVYADNQLRNRTCGICGDFDNEKVAEMRSPKDIPLSSGTLLVASYAFKPLEGQAQGQCEVDQQVQRQVRKEQEQGEQQDRYIPNIHQRGQQYQQKQQERRQQQQQYRKQQQVYQKQQQQQQRSGFFGNIFGRRSSEESTESREYRQYGQQHNQHKLQQKQQQYRQQQQQQQYQQQQQHEKPSQFRQHIQQNPQNRQEVCFSVAALPACRQGYVASKTTPKTVQAHCVEKKSQHAKELKHQIKQGQHVDLAHKQQQPVHIQSPIECIPKSFGQRSSESESSSQSREYSREQYRGHRLSSVQQREDATGKVHETNWQIQGFKATWGRRSAEFCNQGQYVYGMKLTGDNQDARDNQQDQRGLTAVEFLCATPYARQQQPEGVVRDARQSDKITSQKAQGGNKVEEKQAQVCPNKSFVTGVQVHADFNNQHDKTAITSVDLICSNGKTIRGDTVFQGPQKKVLECQAGKRLCGLQTQVEDLQRTSTDHYGLVNMKIQCC